ncbi:MAG: L-rhamnose isomerase [Bacteroidales bacterium]|nr:L-rhamnose isomerase [Bacteroidales bacterium]
MENNILKLYEIAKEQYSEIGVDVDAAVNKLGKISLSLHCWQADDVSGFEKEGASLEGGGIQATGNYPGKARTSNELRMDFEKALSLIPGKHRISLHAIYGDFSKKKADRDKISPENFAIWADWAKNIDIGIDFNSTFFSHPKANDGFTLASKDKAIRDFWIEHGKRCREISEYLGKTLNKRCVHNIWIPDGTKDITVDRYIHRELLTDSLNKILAEKINPDYMRDAVECKLFGIGSESFVVGSHEFYMGYAIKNNTMLCIDIGHFHPTESCADKVSSIFMYIDELLFHVTRGVRWDSDHVVLFNDPVKELMQEVVWADKLDKVCIGLDYFDASINRLGAYVIGARATQKAILSALLDPLKTLREYEDKGQNFEKLALLEECKTKAFGAVWDYYCSSKNVPTGHNYIPEIQKYEKEITLKR